jgi:hypothetical protein
MKNVEITNLYLCGIGIGGIINNWKVGYYNKDRNSFIFSNGSYNETELFKGNTNDNATVILSAVPLQKIDDAELLYSNSND